jgi:hypothetical protein
MSHRASCSCGQLQLTCEGEPVRVSICHCFACQKRTGSAFGYQARFPREQIRDISGNAVRFSRLGDSGKTVTFNFCPACGSTVYWQSDNAPGLISIAIGAFADPAFHAPRHSVYEASRHHWVALPANAEHLD